MAPPSQLSVATSALTRLVKEEKSYHKELEEQKSRLAKFEQEDGDENKEFMLKQQRQAIDETNALFPALRKRIQQAIEKLEGQLETAQQEGQESNAAEITSAKEAIAQAKEAYREAM